MTCARDLGTGDAAVSVSYSMNDVSKVRSSSSEAVWRLVGFVGRQLRKRHLRFFVRTGGGICCRSGLYRRRQRDESKRHLGTRTQRRLPAS